MKSLPTSDYLRLIVILIVLTTYSESLGQQDSTRIYDKNNITGKIEALDDTLKGIYHLPQMDSSKSRAIYHYSTNEILGNTKLDDYPTTFNQTLHDTLTIDLSKQGIKSKIVNSTEPEVPFKLDTTVYKEQLRYNMMDTARLSEIIRIDSTFKEEVESKIEDLFKNVVKRNSQIPAPNETNNPGAHYLEDGKMEATKESLKIDRDKDAIKLKLASHSKSYIEENLKQIQAAQSVVSQFKKKYSMLSNSNDLSSALKRSSLKGAPLRRRLSSGFNINFVGLAPITADISLVLGWKFNTQSEAGLTGSYRTSFNPSQSSSFLDNQRVYGVSTYTTYTVFKNFFGYTEGEYMRTTREQDGVLKQTWTPNLLLGLGRKFSIVRKLQFQTVITYNFLHENNKSSYGSPVVFKTGIRISQ